jgi:monovalent cation/hydrogen antiporter
MHGYELVLLALLVVIAGLTLLSRWLQVPYPIVLVLGGLVLSYVPGMPAVELEPELVLVLFLPPLLYWAAFFSSPRELRVDLRAISGLAVGLVLVTMCAVAVTAHTVVEGLPWAAAFALGAIVAPTDPLAATAIARRLGVRRRIVTLLEGEALVNDATALVAYRIAVTAAVGGSFSLWEAGLRFLVSTTGGIVIGLLIGWGIAELRRRMDDPLVHIVFSLLTGYAAYLPAEWIGVSGVLAAVSAGLFVGSRSHKLMSPSTRLLAFSFWEVLVYLINAALFILIGLQLHAILSRVSRESSVTLFRYAVVVSLVVIVVRIGWQFSVPYLIRVLDRRPGQMLRRIGARERFIIGWSGMRGAVSLAAALALPLQTDAGDPFPQRDLIIFLTFGVIFATLVVQGLTLPLVIKRLRVRDVETERAEELHARLVAAEAAIARLDELAEAGAARTDTIERLRDAYDDRHRQLSARAGIAPDDGHEERSLDHQRLVRELLHVQRRAIVQLRNSGEISNDVMHRIQRDLDLEDSRLEI